MKETDIITQILREYLPQSFEIGSGYMQYDGTHVAETDRLMHDTQDLIVQSISHKRTRGLVSTSQSEYVNIKGVDTVTISWKVDFATDVKQNIADDIQKMIGELTEKTIAVNYGGKTYSVGMTFFTPVAFSSIQTINGIDYQQVVWGGRALITEKSQLAMDYDIYLGGMRVNGLLAFSSAYNATGDNFTNFGNGALNNTAITNYNNAMSIQVHVIDSDPIAQLLMETAVIAEGVKYLRLSVKKSGKDYLNIPSVQVSTAQITASLGSFIVLDAQLLRG